MSASAPKRIRVIAKRPGNPDTNVIDIKKFTAPFDISLYQQIDDGPRELLYSRTFTPGISPGPSPEPEEPQPTGDLLYDSNRDINWGAIQGEFLKVEDIYGEFKPNGRYIRCKASGNPRAYLYPATKEIVLEHDGKYGRLYFGVCNYACKLEGEFKLESCSHNLSLKTRNRHQYNDFKSGSPDHERQGGQGFSVHCGEWDADLETVHGSEVGGPSGKISPKIEPNQWFKVEFSQYDQAAKIHVLGKVNGKLVADGEVKAPTQFFKREQFEEWSEFWVRLNAPQGGKLYVRNLKLYKL